MKPLILVIAIVAAALLVYTIWQRAENQDLRQTVNFLHRELAGARSNNPAPSEKAADSRPSPPPIAANHSALVPPRPVTSPLGTNTLIAQRSKSAPVVELRTKAAMDEAAQLPPERAVQTPLGGSGPTEQPRPMLGFESTAGSGSEVRLDGTTSIHDWTLVGALIAGRIDIDAEFLANPVQFGPREVSATAQVTIPIRTLKSGKPAMDNMTYSALDMAHFPKIEYRLSTLKLSAQPESENGPWSFESVGELSLHGATNTVAFPVTIQRASRGLIITGATNLKMTDFKVKPPVPKITSLPEFQTGNEVKLSFRWVTGAQSSN